MNTNLPDRDKWVGTKPLTIKNISFAFALIEFWEFEGDVALAGTSGMEKHDPHGILYRQKEKLGEAEFRRWVVDCNQKKLWNVTLEATDDRTYDHGPNHCGLVCTNITWSLMRVFTPSPATPNPIEPMRVTEPADKVGRVPTPHGFWNAVRSWVSRL